MVDGRVKGNKYENAVARTLSGWVSEDDDLTNYRTCPVSELLFRRRQADNDNVVTTFVGGRDLMHKPGICFPFTVECKDWKVSFELSTLFRNGDIWKWWQQTEDQASAEPGGWPLLVFSKNQNPDYAIIYEEAASCLRLKPCDGPVLAIQRPSGRTVVLALLSDLARTHRVGLAKLAHLRPLARPPQSETSSACRPGRLRHSLRKHCG